MRESAAITGIGIITPHVNDLDGLAPWCERVPDKIHKTVENIPLPQGILSRELRRTARLTRMALYAADKAMEAAQLKGRDGGLYIGLSHGSTSLLQEFHDFLFDYGPKMASPNAFSNGVTNAPLGAVSKYLGLTRGGATIVGHEQCGMEVLHAASEALAFSSLDFCCAGAAEEFSPLVETIYGQRNRYGGSPPHQLPSPLTGSDNQGSFGMSEASVFMTLCQTSYVDKNASLPYCHFTPVDDVDQFDRKVDCIISGAGGGPQDRHELDALQSILTRQPGKTPLLFSKPLFGETFGVGPLLSVAIAYDMIVHKNSYPSFPVHNSLRPYTTEILENSAIHSVLVIAAARDGRVSAGLLTL